MYEIEYEYGITQTVPTNIIAENLFSTVDSYVKMQMVLGEVVNHNILPGVVEVLNRNYQIRRGFDIYKGDTCGWEVFVQCKDGSTYWLW